MILKEIYQFYAASNDKTLMMILVNFVVLLGFYIFPIKKKTFYPKSPYHRSK